MSLIVFKKTEKPVSLALILCLVFELSFPLTSRASVNITSSSGSSTVASSLSSMVDGYTGDFRYSVPLATLPGPNGENVSISANYHAGITVNQKASWLGLGWDYNPGEITRQVVNTPDDYDGVSVTKSFDGPYASDHYQLVTAMFGSLYNDDINRDPYQGNTSRPFFLKSGDNNSIGYTIPASDRCAMVSQVSSLGCNGQGFDPTSNAAYRLNQHVAPYNGLAYDQYNVSGEGIGGSLHPYYLGTVQIHNETFSTITGIPVSNRKCQFYFENSNSHGVGGGTNPSSTVVNTTTNMIHSGTFVKYFTNTEINSSANLYNSTTGIGYLHYQPTTPSAARTTENGAVIGAFRVTNASGITYHYSLPVYELTDVNANFDAQGRSQVMELTSCHYATSWKLTAITGADYEDTNANYTADEGDTGYWISYNYSLWSSNYSWASQRYNAKSDAFFSPKMINLITSSSVGNQYIRSNSLSFGTTQVYVLNYIKTASHTAYFVKSVRQDEQSYNALNPSLSSIPLLKLDRVVVLRNTDKNLLINTTSLSGTNLDSRFDYTTCGSALSDNNFINITRYNANKTAIDKVALTTAELTTNYSLAKKYIGNRNNVFSTDLAPFSPWSITGHTISHLVSSIYVTCLGFSSSTDLPNSGKLTLKKITLYNLNGEKITPSIDFGYDETNALKNPDFNVDKTDLWGYYKKDYVNSHYVTAVSKDDVDAWSLKEINTSLGGKINITYESDRYHREGFNGDPLFHTIVKGDPSLDTSYSSNTPHLIFPITNIDFSTGQFTFADNDFSVFGINEPLSDPTYTIHTSYLIYGEIDHCDHPPVFYNGGNSSYIPETYSHLMRYGKVFDGTLVGVKPEYDFNCTGTGYSFSSSRANVGVDHVVAFRSYLYGGGVRVKQIAVTDPFSGNAYTQKFDYGNGYCPIVPKSNALSTDNGPSNHDVISNNKSLISQNLTGLVGYNSCRQYSINQKNETSGTVTQNYINDFISNPFSFTKRKIAPSALWISTAAHFQSGTCSSLPVHPDPLDKQFVNYTIDLDVSMSDNSQIIGKLSDVSDGTTNTKYSYAPVLVGEVYNHPTTEVIKYTIPWPYSRGQYTSNPCTSMWSFDETDTYNYNQSQYTKASFLLSSTSTTKDGITITEEITRDPYTSAPVQTKITDPTKGVYFKYTTYAYNTLQYATMGLKTINETNRNLLSAVSNQRTVKTGPTASYVISESKATYLNTYPVRTVSASGIYSINSVTKPWFHLNETYERLLDDDITVATIPLSTDWRKTSVNTLYDKSYNCIEQEGLNSRRTASKWGYNNLYKLASISNANYDSFTFSGFEDQYPISGGMHYGGEVTHGETIRYPMAVTPAGGGAPILVTPHTGYSFAGIDPNATGPAFITSNFNIGRTYVAKVWVHTLSPATAALNMQLAGVTTGGVTVGVTKLINKANAGNTRVNDWILMTAEIDVPANLNLAAPHSLSVFLANTVGSGAAYFDDFTVHPKDAVITGNVYDEKTGLLVAQLDNDNFATIYNYDNALRNTTTYKEYSGGVKKVSESLYHYTKP